MKTFLKNSVGLSTINKWEPNCWVNVESPTESDKKYLLNELEIPEDFYSDIEDIDEKPRIEIEDGWTLIIIRIPIKNADEKTSYSTVPFGIIFKDDVFISVCVNKTEMVSDLITHLKKKKTFIEDRYEFGFKLLLSASVWYLKYLKLINQDIKSAEEKLEKSIANKDLQGLLQIQKCLVYFTTALKGNDLLVHRLKNSKLRRDFVDIELIEDVDIELRQALETTNIYTNILTGMINTYGSVISNNLNVIMKQLTSVSIILMIPTLVASLFGMNVPNGLEQNQLGFVIAITISFILSGLGALIFFKRKWF
jgi:magnesium transporter